MAPNINDIAALSEKLEPESLGHNKGGHDHGANSGSHNDLDDTAAAAAAAAAVSFDSFVVWDAPEQRQIDNVTVPFVLTPPPPSSDANTANSTTTGSGTLKNASDAAAWVRLHRSRIDAALAEHGAVLFRGFPLLLQKHQTNAATSITNAATATSTTIDQQQEQQYEHDFDTFVSQGFPDWQDLSYEKSMSFAVRKRCSDRICTTNEGKNGGLVFHHEQAQTPLWPSRLFFCCELPAAQQQQPQQGEDNTGGGGGETGLAPSHVVYQRLLEKYPDFIQKCEAEGVRYTFYAGPTQDTRKGAGRSWKSFFHVNTKEDCEEKMRAGGWEWEWGVGVGVDVGVASPFNPTTTSHDSQKAKETTTATTASATMTTNIPMDFLKCTTPVLDAVKEVPSSFCLEGGGEGNAPTTKCFFNQLIATTANALEFSHTAAAMTKTTASGDKQNEGDDDHEEEEEEEESCCDPLRDVPTQEGLDACVRFGTSGDTLSLDILLDAKAICEEVAVNVEWQKGDVALVCNYRMMHARRRWNGPVGTRKLLASLVAEPNCTSFGKPLVV